MYLYTSPRAKRAGSSLAETGDGLRKCARRARSWSPRSQVIVVALASWQDRSRTLRAAEDHVQLTVGLLREHALKVFATQELVHEQVQLRTAELDWEAISRSQELASFLRKLSNGMSEICLLYTSPSPRDS